jgi:O-antigen ligase
MAFMRQLFGQTRQANVRPPGEKAVAMSRGEKITWGFFALSSMQLAFLQPQIALVHGARTNLFSGILCFVTLVVAIIFAPRGAIKIKSPAFIISCVLAALAVISGLCSITPLFSSFRVFVLLASGLGGFWCARILLHTPQNQRIFKYFCLFLLTGVLLIGLIGYLSKHIPYFFFDLNVHPVVNIIVLLSFAPLAFLDDTSPVLSWLSLFLLGFCFIFAKFSGELSGKILTLGIFLVAALRRIANWGILLLIFLAIAFMGVHFVKRIATHKDYKYSKGSQSIYYRIENFPFSWKIAKEHPWFGIGLRAPRDKFLKNYVPVYHYVTKEEFAKSIRGVVSSDNTLLTFMAGLGFPFLIIYTGSVIILVGKLVSTYLHADPSLPFSPLALLLPIAASLLYALVFDALLFPQICWFLHIFLGLIPTRSRRLQEAVVPAQESLSCGS